jgi:hypothetical protein
MFIRFIVAAAALTALAAAIFVYVSSPRTSPAASSASTIENSQVNDRAELTRLSAQIEDLQRELQAVKAHSTAQGQVVTKQVAARDAASSQELPDPSDHEALRAAAAERSRAYVERIAHSFSEEKVDPSWAGYASSHVDAALNGNAALRANVRDVQCRAQTCRITIEQDDAATVSRHLPALFLELADVLPTVSAQQVDRGDGHKAMVLYMSSQSSSSSGKARAE